MKSDCYKCIYRCSIPGDAHSRCSHPEVLKISKDTNSFAIMVDVMLEKFCQAWINLNIKANLHGIKMGWFVWPANFDPVWLENCDGFIKK